jgi:hypothetical protein
MADRERANCSPKCNVDHRRGRALNKTCSAEKCCGTTTARLSSFAKHGENDFIVLAAFSEDVELVGANLTLDEAQELRDALDSALRRKRAA